VCLGTLTASFGSSRIASSAYQKWPTEPLDSRAAFNEATRPALFALRIRSLMTEVLISLPHKTPSFFFLFVPARGPLS
jgi:hypothetical protein